MTLPQNNGEGGLTIVIILNWDGIAIAMYPETHRVAAMRGNISKHSVEVGYDFSTIRRAACWVEIIDVTAERRRIAPAGREANTLGSYNAVPKSSKIYNKNYQLTTPRSCHSARCPSLCG
jgi:hypothetical protein